MALIRTAVVADMNPARLLATMTAQRRVTLKGVKAGASIVAPRAKAAAPRRPGSGALKQSIGVKAEKGKRGRTTAFAIIGARMKVVKQVPHGNKTIKAVPGLYSHLVEKGTQAHSLGSGSKIGRKGKASVGQGVGKKHPGAKPHPFLGPAWEATSSQVLQTIERVIGEEVQKEIAKNAAKALAKLKG